MRITFVHPAGSNFVPGKPDLTVLANRMPPLGLLQMAACLDRQGHTIFVHDCLGPDAVQGIDANAAEILSMRPDIVGFSTTTSGFLDACDLAVAIKQRRPSVKTIFGGVHVSAVGAPLLRLFPEIDYLCLGEGEQVMSELASGNGTRDISGLVYRDGPAIVVNPSRADHVDLDSLPWPAYRKLTGFPNKYQLPLFNFTKPHGATMVTSRGCPYSCAYCDRTVFGKKYRCNSPDYVWEHMRYLRDEFRVRHINFYDDLFTLDRERTACLCELLIRKPLGMQFNCAARADLTDGHLLGLLRRAGCLQISLGVETAAPELLKCHKSGMTLETVRRAVDRIHAHRMRVKGLFIMGLPGETRETVMQTSDFIGASDFDDMNLAKFTPFPGAPIWKDCVSGRTGTFRQDWRLMNCLNFCFLPQAFKSVEEMNYLYNECVQRFYKSWRFHKKTLLRGWQNRWSLWRIVTHLPELLYADNQFKPQKHVESQVWPAFHPKQPRAADLLADDKHLPSLPTVIAI